MSVITYSMSIAGIKEYFGRDVHAYSAFLKELIKKYNISNENVSDQEFNDLLDKLRNKYGDCINPCLNNMKKSYFKNGGIRDPDLGNVNIFHILKELFSWNNKEEFQKVLCDIDPIFKDNKIFNHIIDFTDFDNDKVLKETLVEVDMTCIQGLTHRLLLLYLCKKNE